MLLESSILLLEDIYSIGVTHDDQNLFIVQVSISPTFYEQLVGQIPFAKKLQNQIEST